MGEDRNRGSSFELTSGCRFLRRPMFWPSLLRLTGPGKTVGSSVFIGAPKRRMPLSLCRDVPPLGIEPSPQA
jgi:hypothetical protein